MTITKTEVVIDVNDNRTGNFLQMTKGAHPDMDDTDSVYGIMVKDLPENVWVVGGELRATPHSCRKITLRRGDASKLGERLVIDYNTRTGQYEIVLNDYRVTDISKLKLEVYRYNANSRADCAAA
jgi:hypothetical protein